MEIKKSIAIIGGGTAGLSLAYNLTQIGHDFKLFERSDGLHDNGLGFLIMANGLKLLKQMGLHQQVCDQGVLIDEYVSHHKTTGNTSKTNIGDCLAISREDFLNSIKVNLNKEQLFFNKKLIEIEVDQESKKKKLTFQDGHTEEFDIVVASDGFHSDLRNFLFPGHPKQLVPYKEVVGMYKDKNTVAALQHQFIKFNDPESGFNVGIIPGNTDTVLWFIQMNVNKVKCPENNQEAIKAFVKEISNHIPDEYNHILNNTETSKLYLWTLFNVDLVESFHVNDIVLLGDAAHPLLSFTSQGVNSALEDSCLLSKLIINKESFELFNEKRKPVIAEYLYEGRNLLDQFIHPEKYDNFKVPFIQLSK